MPAVVWVVGALVVLVGVLLALDWFTAGRAKGRLLVRARDQNSENARVGYTAIESDGTRQKYEGSTGP